MGQPSPHVGESHRISHPGNRRLTLGLLLAQIDERYQASVWPGIADVAQERDVNLLFFVGESLRSPYGFEAQANAIYDLVSPDRVDGLILMSGSLGNFLSLEEFRDFLQRFRPLPIVNIGLPVEGFPCVVVDNRRGMREAIAHLIEFHGYSRLAFIQGPAGHREAEERYQAYAEALAEHGLALDPQLIVPGDFRFPTGKEAIRLLLEERKVNFEAVIAANDTMALGALEALGEHGLRVPYDVALVGFDDVEDARFATPPLTTVRQPLYNLGRRAAEMLLDLLQGETCPELSTLPTELVLRQSCGCFPEMVAEAAVEPAAEMEPSPGDFLAEHPGELLTEMAQTISSSLAGRGELPAVQWTERLLHALWAELRGEVVGAFLPTLDGVLREAASAGGDINQWQSVLSLLRRRLLPGLRGKEALVQMENLWQQARVLVGETAQRLQAYRRLLSEQRSQMLWEIGQTLSTVAELEELLVMVTQELPRLDIRHGYISLQEKETQPGTSRLVLAYREGERVPLPAGGLTFPTSSLLPDEISPREARYTMVAMPLYFRDTLLGLALFGMGPREGVVYEMLRGQLSSALQGALTLEERRRGEEALARERNLLRTLVDNLPDYIYVKDAEGRFILGNAAVVRQMGVASPDELVGKTDFDFFPRDLAERYYAEEQEIIRSGRGLYEHEGPTVDGGRERWVSTTKVPLRDAQGRVIGFVGLGRDITERKAAEAERERLLATLERRALQLQTAAEVARAVSSILDPDELIQKVVDLVAERFNLYYVGLYLVDATGKWAVLRAGSGEIGRKIAAPGERLEVGGRSMVGWCVANKQPRIAQDVSTDPMYMASPQLPETRSELVLPLKMGERVIGALDVESREVGAFPEDVVTVFQTMADQLTVAMENARTVAEIRQLNEDLKGTLETQARLLETIRALSTPVVPLMRGIILLPLVGNIDTARSLQIMEQLLNGVQQHRAQVAIVDITGVPIVDTSVANSLVRAAQAVNLLGAEVVLVGIRPEVAQTMVTLGVDLSGIATRSDLEIGIEYALERLRARVAVE